MNRWDQEQIRIGSVFSGIEGLGLGFEWVFGDAARTVFQVERETFCRSVLNYYWPDVPKFVDVRTVGWHNLPACDLLLGGFPCQDVSSAGPRVGLSGARSGLWFEFARLIEELGPEWVVVENVASGASKWVTQVRCDLEQLGYETIPIPLSAADCGAPHRRSRVFIVGHSSGVREREPDAEARARRSDGPARGSRGAPERPSGAVADSDRESVRVNEQRVSARRADRVRDQGQAIARDAGAYVVSCGCGGEFVGSLSDPCPECGSIRDAYVNEVADAGRQRRSSRAQRQVEQGGRPDAERCGGEVADTERERCKEQPEARLHAEGQCGDDSARRRVDLRWVWPPGPEDGEGWARWIAEGGPQPSVLRGASRSAGQLHRSRLRAIGNSVTPQQAAVVACVVQELMRRLA